MDKKIYLVMSSNSNDGVIVNRAYTDLEKATRFFNGCKQDIINSYRETETFFKVTIDDDICFWTETKDGVATYCQLEECKLFTD